MFCCCCASSFIEPRGALSCGPNALMAANLCVPPAPHDCCDLWPRVTESASPSDLKKEAKLVLLFCSSFCDPWYFFSVFRLPRPRLPYIFLIIRVLILSKRREFKTCIFWLSLPSFLNTYPGSLTLEAKKCFLFFLGDERQQSLVALCRLRLAYWLVCPLPLTLSISPSHHKKNAMGWNFSVCAMHSKKNTRWTCPRATAASCG